MGFPSNFGELVSDVVGVVSLLIPVIFSIAILAFVWGIAKFIFQSASEVDREKGKQLMVWGLVAIFVMASVYGIILFFYKEFGFTGTFTFPPQLPQ